MKLTKFDYDLPQELIAQTPVEPRDSSRLMVVDRQTQTLTMAHFRDLPQFLKGGDIVVGNNSRVIPARLFGQKVAENGALGGKVELLLLSQLDEGGWRALVRGKRMIAGRQIRLLDHAGEPAGITATIQSELDGAQRVVTFDTTLEPELERLGHVPLPPYIHATLDDAERYQTIYAQPAGSAAAPTAGLHFTGDLLLTLRQQRVSFETVTLHVGLDTFQPVKADDIRDHHIHSEWAELTATSAKRINEAKLAGGRLVAVGTTAMRTLETAALRSAGITGSLQDISARDASGETTAFCPWRPVIAHAGATDLYIYPGYQYRAVDALITNFHLPQSSLLMLVAAFTGYELMREAYATAIAERFRFFSFGDAMLIL